ncbi:PP2C family protein-serine/threonine phosphatase [Vibrio vulnificus]|uniref:PP2C family protein-serine/threonine phosphatase n=1 Tax=Vibrio vulnificus TaxID=672 RepID=UPI0035687F89
MINLIESCSFSYSKSFSKMNEDAMLPPKLIDGGVLFGVADGVGSYAGADLASMCATEHLSRLSCEQLLDFKSVFESILNQVTELSKYNELYEKASTTLTYCVVDSDGLHIGHIGDCRAYIKEGKKLKQLTKDHTQHQQLLDSNIVKKSQLKHIKGKNVITTAISRVVEMKFDSVFIPNEKLSIDDKGYIHLYIMSDGAHDIWSRNPRFSENTLSGPTKLGNSLLRRIERVGAIDDYTFVACKLRIK